MVDYANVRSIVFDLDGTLLDSFPVHFEAYKVVFASFKIEMSRELFLRTYSPNWYQTYEAFGLAKDHWDEANKIWLEEAAKHEAVLFPGVRKMLGELSANAPLGIVTSGSKSRVIRDLERTAIGHHFTAVITGGDIREPKPHPEGLEIAMSEIAIPPQETLYVGDAHADFEMARAAGVRFYGVPSEFANLSYSHPEYEIHPITDLPGKIGIR